MMQNQLLGLRLQWHLVRFWRCEVIITSHPPVLSLPWWTALSSTAAHSTSSSSVFCALSQTDSGAVRSPLELVPLHSL